MPYYDTVTQVLEKRITAPTAAWVALRYGSTNAKGRKYIGVFNRSPYKIYVTTDNNDTAAASMTTNPAHTRAIRAGGERIFPYSDKVTLYARSVTGGATLVVTEECG